MRVVATASATVIATGKPSGIAPTEQSELPIGGLQHAEQQDQHEKGNLPYIQGFLCCPVAREWL